MGGEAAVTDEVGASLRDTADPGLRELLTGLVRHLHAFARETRLTQQEWERAVGFLMATHGLDEAAAIGLLREVSMDLNLRLREVALAVVNRRGELPSA